MNDPQNRWDEDLPTTERGGGLLGQTVRNVGFLAVACLLLVGGFTQFGGSSGTESEPASESRRMPGPSAQEAARDTVSGDELIVRAGRNGHFLVDAVVDGVEIRFLVDTGATNVILTAEDSERLGYRLDSLEYSQRFQTANGQIVAAPVVLPDLRIGDLEFEDVHASVVRTPLNASLLGMSFLARLDSFEVRDEGLVLRW